MLDAKEIKRSYWTKPLVLKGEDVVTYEKIRQDKINEQKEIDASHWVYGNPYSAYCDNIALFIWLVRVGLIVALLLYTGEAGYEIGWVIALIILFVLMCGSLFVCNSIKNHAWEDNTRTERTEAGQKLINKIDNWDQEQLKRAYETENPKRVITASSRVQRKNFKLTRY